MRARGTERGGRADTIARQLRFILLILGCFICLQGIAAHWTWGHEGFNGSAFSNAARNSIQHGIVAQAQYHLGDNPPQKHELYTHHPLLIHAHLVTQLLLLGDREAGLRLVPIVYSMGILWLLALWVRARLGETSALLTIVGLLMLPQFTIFSWMINHEQGGIFWGLAFCVAYVEWAKRRGLLLAAAVALCGTLACQFDWPGYYFIFFAFLHHTVLALARRDPWRRWLPFSLMLVVVALSNFGLFFAWIFDQVGGLDEMRAAFAGRSSGVPFDLYFQRTWDRECDLKGYVGLIGIAISVMAVLTGRPKWSRALWVVNAAFLFAGILQLVVFRQAGYIHSYWHYYLLVPAALGFLIGMRGVATFASSFLSDRSRRLSDLLSVVLGCIYVCLAAYWVAETWWMQRSTGTGSYIAPFKTYNDQLAWADHFALVVSPKTSEVVLIHRSVEAPRMEFLYYVGTHYRTVYDLRAGLAGRYLLCDRDRMTVAERGSLEALLGTHRAWIWDERFFVVDLALKKPKVTRFYSEADSRTSLAQWFSRPVPDRSVAWRVASVEKEGD